MSKIKEITVSSKRSCQIQGEFFTFEASELISLETDDNIDEVRQKAWSRVNDEVDNLCKNSVKGAYKIALILN